MMNDDNIAVLVVHPLVDTSPTAATWQVGSRGPSLFATCGSCHSSGGGDGGRSSCLVTMRGWWAPVARCCSWVVVLVVGSRLVEVGDRGSSSSSSV